MANKKKTSGYFQIINAQELFEQSVAEGRPDFRYVALAIGDCPPKPPQWAVDACIAERDATKSRTPSLDAHGDGELLDEVVRVLDDHQKSSCNPKKKSLRSAIYEAMHRIDPQFNASGPMDDNLIRKIRAAWKREQKDDQIRSAFVLEGYHTTHRIHRVIMAAVGNEHNMPTDPVVDLWKAENSRD